MIEFTDIQKFAMMLFGLSGVVLTVGGAVNLLLNWKKTSKVEKHELAIKDHEERIKDLERDKKEKDGFTKVMCNSILALLSHEINGNSRDKLEQAKEELQEFLINK